MRSRRDDDADVYNQDDNHNVYDDRGRGGEGGGGAAGEYTTDKVQSPVASDAQDNGQEDVGELMEVACSLPPPRVGKHCGRNNHDTWILMRVSLPRHGALGAQTVFRQEGRPKLTRTGNHLLPESFYL